MGRYIDADKLKNSMFNYYECVNENTDISNYTGEKLTDYQVAWLIEDCIDNAPTADVVEVVRCKNCKYFRIGNYLKDLTYCSRLMKENGGHIGGVICEANDFCSYGRRKESY